MKARPAKPGRQPEPSVAWSWGDPGCEAYTGSVTGRLLSPEISNRESRLWSNSPAAQPTPFIERKAAPTPPNIQACRLTGVEEHGTDTWGFPRNVGGPDRLRLDANAAGGSRTKAPSSLPPCSVAAVRKGAHGRYRGTKATK